MKCSQRILRRVPAPLSSRKVTSCFYIFVLSLTVLNSFVGCCFLKVPSHLGYTYPSGDITLHVGQPLELFCSINLENAKAENFTIDDLVFRRDSSPIDERYVTRVNETTIRLYMENNEESDHMYYCYLMSNKTNKSPFATGNAGPTSSLEVSTSSAVENSTTLNLVCMNMVVVGREPKEVENFTCISHNLQSLQCSWDVPKNYVKTNYTIRYMPRHRNQREAVPCPNDTDVKNHTCVWTLNSKPTYRKNFEELKMLVTGTNVFNRTEQSFTFNHYAHILPDAPKELRYANKTTSSILLQWDIDDLQYFQKNWTYKIRYMSNGNEWVELIVGPKHVSREGKTVSYNVTNLTPNMLYNFRVFMKSSVASDKYWSHGYASQLLRTNPRAPARSPKTDVGSFQFEQGSRMSMRTVYVYWQQLHVTEHYGENFHYVVETLAVDAQGNERPAADAKCISLNYSFAKYEIGSSAYHFTIRSANDEGAAPNASSVRVPAAGDEIDSCFSFSKTDFGNNIYELSWQPPQNEKFAEQIVDYTTFWCQTEKERPYQCDGFIEWMHLPAADTKHNFSINSSASYQFAISANTRSSSSGMLWATCTVLHGHLGTVKHLYASQVGPTFVNVAWKLECWDQATAIAGFLVDYCPTYSRNDTRCLQPERKISWSGNAHKTSGNITSLEPFTFYKVNIRMFTADKEGASSMPAVFQTSDGPPKVDGLRITLVNRTNVSATVAWDMPVTMNGNFQHFLVKWRRQDQADQSDDDVKVKTTRATLSNLDSYTKYAVSVLACTTVCSLPIGPLEFHTRVGVPDAPSVEPIPDLKGADAEVWWNAPAHTAGPNPFYELVMLRHGVPVMSKNVTNGTRTSVSAPDCSGDKGALYAFKVRAINVDDEDRDANAGDDSPPPPLHFGPWSSIYTYDCANSGLSTTWKVLACIFFPLFFAIVFFYGGRKGLYKCRQMKSVQVTIPMKFSLATSTGPTEFKTHDVFENYSIVPPFRAADEFSNLVDRTTEQTV